MSNKYTKNYDLIDWGPRKNYPLLPTFAMIPPNPNKPFFVPILYPRGKNAPIDNELFSPDRIPRYPQDV